MGESDKTFLDNLQHQSWDDVKATSVACWCEQKRCGNEHTGSIHFGDMPDDIKRAVGLAVQGAADRARAMEMLDGRYNGDESDLKYAIPMFLDIASTLKAEVDRLTAWLTLIDGGDEPCHNAQTLQFYAFKALQGDEVPE